MGGASIALSALGDLKTPFVLLAVGMFSAGVAGIDSLRE